MKRTMVEMDTIVGFITDYLVNALAHRIGVAILRMLTGGKFKGESGFAWGWAVALGGVVLVTLFGAFIALMIYIVW